MNIADELIKLKQLHDSGALSDEEFSKAKQVVLNQGGATESAKPAESMHDHLLRKKTTALPLPTDPLPYAPVAPRVARFEPNEIHHFTFTISPHVYKEARLFPPRFAGWHGDFTRFIWHITDRRIVIEPYELTATESAILKGASLIGNLSLSGKVTGAGYKEEVDAANKEMNEMRGHALAVPFTEIAQVEKMNRHLVRATFKKPDIEPLVFTVCAGIAGALSLYWHSADFIRELNALLASSAGTKV